MTAPLPIRNGVSPSRTWLHEGSWATVYDFLCDKFTAVSPEDWKQRMQAGEVMTGKGEIIAPDAPYQSGTHLFYYRELATEIPVPFHESIIYEDEQILIADKPHFLPVMPAGRFLQQTLLVRLRNTTGLEQLNPLHRIDRDTAGLVMFSKQPETRAQYHLLFQERTIHKHYEAIAPTLPSTQLDMGQTLTRRSKLVKGSKFFLMQEKAGEPNSETVIEYLSKGENLSHYKLSPITGKQHQLRVHLNALNIPILNDPFYPTLLNPEHNDFSKPMQLLAKSLSFTDPVTGKAMNFTSQQTLQTL